MNKITKKYIFARKLDGKPIEIDLMTTEDRQRYSNIRKLFQETGIFRKIEPDDHGRNMELTHEIHVTVPMPRGGKPYVSIIEPCRFTNDAYGDIASGENNTHFLP